MTDIAAYRRLFINRDDVYAVQQENGSYFPVAEPITDDDIGEHLAGFASYGTYVITPDNQSTTYLCFDLDILDERAAYTLCDLVTEMVDPTGLGAVPNCCVREFSGRKGTHVWLFLDEPVPAEKLRRWVSADFMPKWREAAEANGWPPALEVFPKQDVVAPGAYGNLVKLPLGVHQVSGQRSTLVDHLDWPTELEDVVPFPASCVPEREATSFRSGSARRPEGVEGPAGPFPCVNEIQRNGVGKGVRDNAMFHLALYFYGHGLDEDLALESCTRANEQFQPPMKPDEVKHKVTSAYRGTYESATCGTDWLSGICPGPCKAGWHVKEEPKANALATAREGDLVEVQVLVNEKTEQRHRVTVAHPDAQNRPTFVCRD